MRPLVECIPNFSEGRRPEVVDEIVAVIRATPEVNLLDREMDPDHNRCVLTFVGSPGGVVRAAVGAAGRAAQLIDLTRHRGEHPRIGATDVVPFVPIRGVTMQGCVELARRAGEEIARRYGIPIYLYEEAATRPERRDLAQIRKGEFEGLREEIGRSPDRQPDFGEARVHPTAGATVVGARKHLIAYNVYLGTTDVDVAKQIARSVRFSGGGFRYVKALGFEIKERNRVQVSMNLVDYEGTPIFRAFEFVKREAQRHGVPVLSSQIVGLVPRHALDQCSEYYLQLEGFSPDQVLETRLERVLAEEEAPGSAFLQEVASSEPVPGGGSVSAYVGALGAALGRMVCALTRGKKKYEAHQQEIIRLETELRTAQDALQRLVTKDAEAYRSVSEASRRPRESDEQLPSRDRAIQEALKLAVQAPLEVAEQSVRLLQLLVDLAPVGNVNAASDLGVGALLAHAAARGADYNVRINVRTMTDAVFKAEALERIARLLEEANRLELECDSRLAQHLG
ncbi:MAG: glutamate formimidoyltransferase [Acidobacteria bacterium]|nr:glutamate formimidoyltransferase [Acidobacteriota bacterium]